MSSTSKSQRIPVSVLEGAVFASLQSDHTQLVFEQLAADILRCTSVQRAKWVLLDVSGLLVMDEEGFSQLDKLGKMLQLLGAGIIVIGLRPGVIAGLAQMDVDLDELQGTVSVERALELIRAVA